MTFENNEIISQEKVFELLIGMKDGLADIRVKLEKTNGNLEVTNANIKKYNGLLERQYRFENELSEMKTSQVLCQAKCETKEKVEDKIEDKQDKKKNIFRLDVGNVIQIAIGIVAIIALLK